MLSFVRNRKGGNNILDGNGYKYRIRRTVPEKDRAYWLCGQEF